MDVVTASPYHPELGAVRNVPRWRLTLSKGATWLYRRILRQKLSTYTSCFRVYRRSSVAGITLTYGRYLGVAETDRPRGPDRRDGRRVPDHARSPRAGPLEDEDGPHGRSGTWA